MLRSPSIFPQLRAAHCNGSRFHCDPLINWSKTLHEPGAQKRALFFLKKKS
jgi:hypothetical protein